MVPWFGQQCLSVVFQDRTKFHFCKKDSERATCTTVSAHNHLNDSQNNVRNNYDFSSS